MRLAILKSSVASFVLFGLISTTGCSASRQTIRHSMSPVGVNVADTSSDPSWTPPGEMDLTIIESAHGFVSTRASADAMPMPNRQTIGRRQIRAAIY
jgi:hypothetical protein